jgi:hypothetical protein
MHHFSYKIQLLVLPAEKKFDVWLTNVIIKKKM